MTRPCGERCSSTGRISACQTLLGRLVHRVESVGRGLVRAEQPEVLLARVGAEHVAEELAEQARRLRFGRSVAPSIVNCVVAEVGQLEIAEQHAAVRVRVRAHAARSLRQPVGDERQRRAVGVEQLVGTVRAHPLLRGSARCSGLVRTSESGTWCARHVPSTGTPSTTPGPVHPFGVRNTIIGQRGRSGVAALARVALDVAGSRRRRCRASPRAAGARARGRRPRRGRASSRGPRRTRVSSSSGMRASTVGFAIL